MKSLFENCSSVTFIGNSWFNFNSHSLDVNNTERQNSNLSLGFFVRPNSSKIEPARNGQHSQQTTDGLMSHLAVEPPPARGARLQSAS